MLKSIRQPIQAMLLFASVFSISSCKSRDYNQSSTQSQLPQSTEMTDAANLKRTVLFYAN